MSSTTVDIDRIELTLHGVSPAEAQSAASEMGALLRQRLAGWRPDIAGASPVDLGNVDLGRVDVAALLDTRALATLIADRLIGQLDRALTRPSATSKGV
jgi:hypothetical protein